MALKQPCQLAGCGEMSFGAEFDYFYLRSEYTFKYVIIGSLLLNKFAHFFSAGSKGVGKTQFLKTLTNNMYSMYFFFTLPLFITCRAS